MLQRQVCFFGHSIVVGVGSSTGKRGGFREDVLEGLRSAFGHQLSAKPVGPIVTGFFTDSPIDDSCLAVPSKTSYHMYDSLRLHPALNADIWVMMLGVNGDFYNTFERFYIVSLMENIHARNPNCELYVLNGLPLPDSIDPSFSDSTTSAIHQRLLDFNTYLEEKVNERAAIGWHIKLVDAFSAVSRDSAWVPEYFLDPLHPNDEGYVQLGAKILETMGIAPPGPAKTAVPSSAQEPRLSLRKK
jgi:hypothetical protein